jgi:S-adenosylmethionine uptake transporter
MAWMVAALLSFAGMAVGIRGVGGTLSTFAILFWRSLVGLCVLLPIVLWYGPASVRTAQPIRQVVRNVVHFTGQYFWTLALTLIPLGILTALEFTNPLWATLFAVWMLGERFSLARLTAVLCGFAGVLVILRPGLAVVDPAAPLVLLAAALYAYAHIAGKQLVRTDSPLAVVFWMCVVQLPMALVPSLPDWRLPTAGEAPWLLLVGLGGLSAHYCLSQAFKRADAMIVVPVDFLRLPLMTAIGVLAYAEAFDPWVILGGAIICAGIWVNLRAELRRRR